jgi:cellulase (glycosyl hydrolase family 5)
VLKPARLMFLMVTVLLAVGASQASAGTKMPIGFFDDNSFRWSADRMENLTRAGNAGASVIHTTANWAQIAPTRPATASDQNDPAYHLNDLDELVAIASQNGMRVMIDITGTPKWANGNKAPNRMPRRLADLTTFSRLLADRYDGAHGKGYVGLYGVWNEPNLELFLYPQFSGKKIVGPANYAKLYKAAYAGIKAGNSAAQVAIGETSARGRDKPLKGLSGTVAPGTFARLLAQQKGLKFNAWAHHPYPTSPNLPPTQKVRYPNVTLSTIKKFEADLKKWFHRTVPVWITEYGHETKPPDRHGVSYATQSKWARQALSIAKADQNIQMFIWFTFRDTAGNPWQSGLISSGGAFKPAYGAFGAVARVTDGITTNVKAGRAPSLTLYFPHLSYYNAPGEQVGMTYYIRDGKRLIANGQPQVPMRANQSLVIPLSFKPVKGHSYTVTVDANDAHGNTETRVALLRAT